MSSPKQQQQRSGAMRSLAIFAAICVGMAVGIAVIVWSAGGFSPGALSGHGLAALIIGSVLSLLLTVVLMGLVFYSNRSELDRDVHDVHRSDGGGV
jgi:cation transporter-like permease